MKFKICQITFEKFILIPADIVVHRLHKKHLPSVQGDQVTENFRADPEKLRPSRKPGFIFQNPEFKKNNTNFLIFMGIFMNFDKNMSRECKVSQKIYFMTQSIKHETDFLCSLEKYFWKSGHPEPSDVSIYQLF